MLKMQTDQLTYFCKIDYHMLRQQGNQRNKQQYYEFFLVKHKY